MEIIILSLLIILIIISALILKSKNNVESLDENRELKILSRRRKNKKIRRGCKNCRGETIVF